MSTALFEVAESVERRKHEIDILVDSAASVAGKNQQLYDATCRASCVLLASHIEGFVKDAIRSIIADFNYFNKDFNLLPTAMQRSFCHRIAFFEGVSSKEIDNRIDNLIVFFNKNSVPVDLEAFPYKEKTSKNASPALIDAAFNKIGVASIVNSIAIPAFDPIFDNDSRTSYSIIRDLRRFRSLLYHFPYRSPPPHTHSLTRAAVK